MQERCWQALGSPQGGLRSEVGTFSMGVTWEPGRALARAPVAGGPSVEVVKLAGHS